LRAPETALLPREPSPGAPVFAVPWHAEVLGIANALMQSGMFSEVEWAETLGVAIRRIADAGEPDNEETYYQAVLGSLEQLVGEKSPVAGGLLLDRVEAWRRAYLNTPHGQPVTLDAAALSYDGHDHDHHRRQRLSSPNVSTRPMSAFGKEAYSFE
jgi:nitrile hydratase accessory protein